MLGKLLVKILVPVLLALFAALPFVWFGEHGMDVFRAAVRRFRRLSVFGQLAVAVFVVCLVVRGSTKNSPANGPAPASRLLPHPSGPSGSHGELTSGQIAAGFVLRRAGEVPFHDFDPPTNAVVRQTWLKRGASEDCFPIVASADCDWSFPFGTGMVRRLTVSAQGALLLHYGTACENAQEGARLRDLLAGPEVRADTMLMAPLRTRLGVLPEARHGLLPVGTGASRFWHAATEDGRLLLTWQNVALARDASAPVCIQVELRPSGNFVYRYRLPSVPDAYYGTDLLVGAWNGGCGESLADNALGIGYADLFAHAGRDWELEWWPLDPVDASEEDRDGDGLPTYDELYLHGTDPGCFDTDGDGLGDGAELAANLDALLRDTDGDGLVDGSDPAPSSVTPLDDLDGDGLPDAYETHWFGGTNAYDTVTNRDDSGFTLGFKMSAGLNPTNLTFLGETVFTNRLVAYKLWDGFAAPWSREGTNLVYERTIRIDRQNNWQQFFLSSAPNRAGGWELEGLALEWEDDRGGTGRAIRSPFNDSMYVPLTVGEVGYLTFRLRATDSVVRSRTPVYLLAYAPELIVTGGQVIPMHDGVKEYVFTKGADSRIGLVVDRSGRPCRAGLHANERLTDGLDALSPGAGGFAYEGDCTGGIVKVAGSGVYSLPESRVRQRIFMRSALSGNGPRIFVLSPWIGYTNGLHCWSWGSSFWHADEEVYGEDAKYPLDSPCLWRMWHRPRLMGYCCTCEVSLSSGVEDGDVATTLEGRQGRIHVCGTQVWSGIAVHPKDGSCNSFTKDRNEVLSWLARCGDCIGSCADGSCDSLEGPDMASVKFRIPLGMPAMDTLAGFVFFDSDGPLPIQPSAFRYLFNDEATNDIVTVESAEMRRVTYHGVRGRDVLVAATNNGVRVTIRTTDSGRLEHGWEITNPDGDASQVRFRKISRQNNVMEDWTYSCEEDGRGGWTWSRFDNIARLGERLERIDRLNDPEARTLEKTRTKYDERGRTLGSVRTVSAIVGERENAALREVLREENTGRRMLRRTAEYWRDDEHFCRNGLPRLVRGDDVSWQYHDWNEEGLEILRVEQLDGSAVPGTFPQVVSNGLAGVSDDLHALVTVFDYTPLVGDTEPAGEDASPRLETQYAVRAGVAVCIGRTWHRYGNVVESGIPCVRHETWRAADASATFGSSGNAYSSATFVEPLAYGVSTVMAGRIVETVDANGVRALSTYATTNGVIVRTTRTFRNGQEFPTYSVEEIDASFGTLLRQATFLAEGDILLADERSVYDEKNRLRSTAFSDGSSLTNSYSCCRLLWSSDRAGRRRLRSGRTGSDHLYNADEDVWLQQVSTNGYRVTQHFLDGLGRETNTVVYVGLEPGEADDWTVSEGRWLSSRTTDYPDGGSDHRIVRDNRGLTTETWTDESADRTETRELVYADDIAPESRMETTTVLFRNGANHVRRAWNGQWTEQIRLHDYDGSGRKVAYKITESSDYGTVTNTVTVHDWLDRPIRTVTSLGATEYLYEGAGTCCTQEVTTSGGIVRTTERIYDILGRERGVCRDGVLEAEEESYREIGGDWWRIRCKYATAAGVTNGVAESRERLTGLSDSCRGHRIDVSPDGVVTETVRQYDPETGFETETVSSSALTQTLTRVSFGGVMLEATGSGTTTFTAYDALGRENRTERTVGPDAVRHPVWTKTYVGAEENVAMTVMYTNATDGVSESYAYDSAGRRIAVTNALDVATEMQYDGAGRLVAETGGTYPVRYGYDTEGRRTSMSTTRDGTTWDVTRWTYDPMTGHCQTKTYADGTSVRYTYTPDGLPLQTVQPSGKAWSNVYDLGRRLVGVAESDGGQESVFANDAFGRRISESNDTASCVYWLANGGIATNEVVSLGTNVFTLVRTLDGQGRISGLGLAGRGWRQIAYAEADSVTEIGTSDAVARYRYDADGLVSGYALTLANGTVVTRSVTRDPFRRGVIRAVSNFVDGVAMGGFFYGHDALGRVVRRNADTFAYDFRDEVTSATISGIAESHAYDEAGNWSMVSRGGNVRTFAANELNQYVSAGGGGTAVQLEYSVDGELATYGNEALSYDAFGRLVSVTSNGVEVIRNAYDPKGRRVRIETAETTHELVYDGWIPMLETVVRGDGTVDEIEYVWGLDLSGSRSGAGGIGGLLYLKLNGAIYVPLYDANGNVTAYCDAYGTVVAEYVYDAFGRTQSATGVLAERFRIRFSTKYVDAVTGFVNYGYRFYDPVFGRWLTRDPLEEEGGANLYAFCRNNAVNAVDLLGGSSFPTADFAHWAICDEAYKVALWFLHSAQDRRAWTRYTFHDGVMGDRDIALLPNEVREIAEKWTPAKEMVKRNRSRCTGSRTFRISEVASGSVGAPWERSIGNVSVIVTSRCSNGCFSYSYSIDDPYDFDIRGIPGRTDRSAKGEAMTIVVNWTDACLRCGWQTFVHRGRFVDDGSY